MNRRGFLGVLSAGLASTLLPGAAAPGVTSREIKIGMSAAFKGTSAGLGIEFYRGAQAYYTEVNAKGGVHGRAITVVAVDDGYNPDPCIKNTIHLVREGLLPLELRGDADPHARPARHQALRRRDPGR